MLRLDDDLDIMPARLTSSLKTGDREELISRDGLKSRRCTLLHRRYCSRIAPKLAGQIRTEVAKRLDLIDTTAVLRCALSLTSRCSSRMRKQVKIIFTHNPFSMPQGGLDSASYTRIPLTYLAYQYDIVCNGVELSSGAVRNHDIEIMIESVRDCRLPKRG